MQSSESTRTQHTIPEILEVHGYDLIVVSQFLHKNLARDWKEYHLVKGGISNQAKDDMLFKICHIQRLLCAVRAGWLQE